MKQTIQLRWGWTEKILFIYRIDETGGQQTLAVVKPGESVDVLFDCCGIAAVFDAIPATADMGGES